MGFPERYAIMIDGEWAKKTLQKRLRRFPLPDDIMHTVGALQESPELCGLAVYRIFYYTANPLDEVATNPLDGSAVDFGRTLQHRQNKSLIDSLDNMPDFAVRRGSLSLHGWRIGPAAEKLLIKGQKHDVQASDLQPNIQQKGVDMRIGLDIAAVALKRLASSIVVVSGDADLEPALRLARTEGLRVFLATLGEHVRPDLRVHADRVLAAGRPSASPATVAAPNQ